MLFRLKKTNTKTEKNPQLYMHKTVSGCITRHIINGFVYFIRKDQERFLRFIFIVLRLGVLLVIIFFIIKQKILISISLDFYSPEINMVEFDWSSCVLQNGFLPIYFISYRGCSHKYWSPENSQLYY